MQDKRVVLDIETKKSFDEVGGRNHLEKLGVSVVGLYQYATGEYRCYEEKEFGLLQNLLIDATLIIGFNHVQFDMPVLQPHFSVDMKKLPCFDIMLDLQAKLGHRIGLDSLASATLGVGKTGSGLDAIRFYNEGRFEELKSYCLNDVKVTKDVYEFGLKNKKVHFHSKFGQTKKDVKVDWSSYGKNLVNKLAETPRAEPAQYKLF